MAATSALALSMMPSAMPHISYASDNDVFYNLHAGAENLRLFFLCHNERLFATS